MNNMRSLSLLLLLSSGVSAQDIPNREPDIKSIPARLEDYYTYDKELKDWVWTPDYKKKHALRKKLPPPLLNPGFNSRCD